MIEHINPDREPVPTVRELYERKDGTAEAVDWTAPKGKKPYPTKFRLTQKGHDLLGGIMARNARASLAQGTQNAEGVAAVRRAAGVKGEGSGGKSTRSPS